MEAIVEAVYRDEPFPVEMTNDMLDQLDPSSGKTPLELAACLGKPATIAAILKARPDLLHKEGVSGFTPVQLSSFWANKTGFEALFAAGANINSPAVNGLDCKAIAVSAGHADFAKTIDEIVNSKSSKSAPKGKGKKK
ncbi:Oidioi.mRNA.OKI2018_I69.PAR.g11859.t1.cds [Oikopleura dioica]|uniref:Oidioi.mRNA.OKI2018_I69.PAR.g11859.t1.cds n=1 Tax=Oikopleura dioica TaxID=34765 RepID=A0ABN7RXP1_OIKDI|nr:Oidioi.mRNA.OKI2018_I69.PAR.g11859.t1.cds [Oikopleura dioica]